MGGGRGGETDERKKERKNEGKAVYNKVQRLFSCENV
jgi:hypothetical protein